MKNKKITILLTASLFLTGSFITPFFALAQEEPEPLAAKASLEEMMEKISAELEGTSKDTEKTQEQAAEEKASGESQEYAPILRIEQVSPDRFSMEFRNLEIRDLLRVVAHNYNLNILVDNDLKGKVTASFSNVSLNQALEAILADNNLLLEKQGDILKVSPNLVSQTFFLKHIEANDLVGAKPAGGDSESKGSAANTSTIFNLLSEDGKVFLGQLPNSILVIDYPKQIAKISEYIQVVDQRMASKVFKLKYLSVSEIVDKEEGSEGQK